MANKLVYENVELNFSQADIKDSTVSSFSTYSSSKIKNLLDQKQNTLAFDTTPTLASNNPVTSGGVEQAIKTTEQTINQSVDNKLKSKQNTLSFDALPLASSSNPVTSKGIKQAIDDAVSILELKIKQSTASLAVVKANQATSDLSFTLSGDVLTITTTAK